MPIPEPQSYSRASTDGLFIPELLTAVGNARSGNKDYDYNLQVIPQYEFNLIHCFVEAIFDQGRQQFDMKLMTITDQISLCPQKWWEYINKEQPLGCSMPDPDPEKFHIWMNPAFKLPYFKFYMVLLHELTHGYAGMQYGHNSHWRRWYYRVLWHCVKAEMIPKPVDQLKYVCVMVEKEYNRTVKVDPMLTILEAFSKAEKEHDQVMSNYFRRLGSA